MHQTVGMSEKPILNVNPLPDITSEVVEIVRDLIKIETGIRGIYDFELKALAKILKVSADCLLGGSR